MERFSSRALVLSCVDYGEADRIVALLTDGRGRLSAFARGARKSRRRFAGALEPFTLLKVQLVETRAELCRLEGAEVLEGFGGLREDIGRVARASYASELVRELVREREPQEELFDLLLGFLLGLASAGFGPQEMMRFELSALAAGGLMPRLDACARCGEEGPRDALFDPEHGGLLCPRCAAGLGVRVSAEASRLLAALQRPVAGAAEAAPPGHVRAEARALLSRFVSHHLGRRLKSLEFMRQVGIEA
ncbi:MAG: DNA repair protein RecO [Deltaproteobacteria bacterium]|nr:DNA repair protein RecO [Deltaproteobacteria bacterium]